MRSCQLVSADFFDFWLDSWDLSPYFNYCQFCSVPNRDHCVNSTIINHHILWITHPSAQTFHIISEAKWAISLYQSSLNETGENRGQVESYESPHNYTFNLWVLCLLKPDDAKDGNNQVCAITWLLAVCSWGQLLVRPLFYNSWTPLSPAGGSDEAASATQNFRA